MESLTKDKIKKLSIFLLLVLAILAMTGIIAYAADVNSTKPNQGVRFYTGEGMLGLQYTLSMQ
jgi:cytochrome c biogenesis protein ResB